MAFYSQEVIEEIRSQNEIVDLISSYLSLKKQGKSYFGLCPFHNEKSPSFSVSFEKQIYYCFGCGAAGNVITFVMQMEHYDFPEAIKFLAERVNYDLPESNNPETQKKIAYKKKLLKINVEAAKFFYKNLIQSKECLNYLSKRGIENRTIKKFGLGYADGNLIAHLKNLGYDENDLITCGLTYKNKFNQLIDKFLCRIMFPIFDVHNKVIAFGGRVINDALKPKYLNSPETVLFIKSAGLYNLNLACKSGQKELILTEGYMDTISLYQAGFKNVCAALGTAFSIKQAGLIKNYFDSVILLFDNDEAGKKAITRAIDILDKMDLNIKILLLENAKDPDEYIKKFGVDGFKNLLENKCIGSVEFKINCLKNNYDLKDVSQKTKFTKEVIQIIFNLSDKIKQEIYIRKVADMLNISEKVIREEVEKKKFSGQKIKANDFDLKNKKSDKKDVLLKAKADLINILLKEPSFILRVKKVLQVNEVGNDIFAGLLNLIYELKETDDFINPSMLINYFETQVEQAAVAKVLNQNIFYCDLEKALNDIIKIIKKEHINQEIVLTNDVERLKNLLERKKIIDKISF